MGSQKRDYRGQVSCRPMPALTPLPALHRFRQPEGHRHIVAAHGRHMPTIALPRRHRDFASTQRALGVS
jgi:hypothetical protein